MRPLRWNELFAEFLGTLLLIVAVVGSGIMGQALSAGNTAVALLANSIATGAGLFVLIHIFGPISGAHFNPVVTAFFRLKGDLDTRKLILFSICQISGGIIGIWITHFIFNLPIIQISGHARDGIGLFGSEVLATFGLLLTVVGFSKHAPAVVPAGVGLYIMGAYWFTSSTSFANPAVTIARCLTDTFAGIAPHSVILFIVAQFVGMLLLNFVWRLLLSESEIGT